ncbi:SAM-dependent methyltransferase [Corallococcus terminator]|uniref:Class I SAM-dependent methyltransferase n=1 Tax=Corallococcus terminator TaxID=2316733 RepID=A0A3A8JSU4_9BACT|nr:methyltransferase domain-containing protein [Corallococcus terminator]RKG92693.1 class I SAM-dependent methyltransferase [Corallococcus terminator]
MKPLRAFHKTHPAPGEPGRGGASESLPASGGSRPHALPNELRAYHEALATRGLARYGPGPRVHCHMGLVDRLPTPGTPATELRERLRASQEALLAELARAMGPFPDGGDVMDVGSGLGGSALYWAQEHRASVTAMVNVPEHVEQVRRFAHEAGVGHRVQARMTSAEESRGRARFDAIIAVENACDLPRADWLRVASSRLKPGGLLAIADCFWVRPGAVHPSGDAWRTHLGRVNEFLAAAQQAGLELEVHDDVSARTVGFWTLTSELLVHEHMAHAPANARNLRAALNAVRMESQRDHLWLQQGLMDGGLEYALLVLRREP